VSAELGWKGSTVGLLLSMQPETKHKIEDKRPNLAFQNMVEIFLLFNIISS
jgi:hypothetical protein